MTLGLDGCGTPSATKAREFVCERCHSRCTEGTEGTEYGHKRDCPDRPDQFTHWVDDAYDPSKDDLLQESSEVLATDGGQDVVECDGCGSRFAAERRRIYIQPDAKGGAHLGLCPDCQTDRPSDRLYKPATDGGRVLEDLNEKLANASERQLQGARVSGIANFQEQPDATLIQLDEIVKVTTDARGIRRLRTRSVRADGTLGSPVREIPLDRFDCENLEVEP